MNYIIKIEVKAKKVLNYYETVSRNANVENIILKYHYEDDKLFSEGWFEIYRISVSEMLRSKLCSLMDFLCIPKNRPIVEEADLLGCGEAYAYWIFADYISKGDIEIIRAMVLEEVKKEMKKIVEAAHEISDLDEAKEYIFKNAAFFRKLLENPEIGVLYVAAKKYWREVVKEDPTEILKLQRVQLLLKEDES